MRAGDGLWFEGNALCFPTRSAKTDCHAVEPTDVARRVGLGGIGWPVLGALLERFLPTVPFQIVK